MCIGRLQAGDESARDELLAESSDRLTRLTRKMLRDYPRVRRWEQTDDVLQNATMRLCRALKDVQPATVADFFRLAAAQIRRELIDLARRHSGSRLRLSIRSDQPPHDSEEPPGGFQTPDQTHDPDRLATWSDFHCAVEKLPAEERETFDLLFYQGLSQAEACAVLGISERTIKRRWQAARLKLCESLDGRMPSF